ncbi:MAG TPA: NAD(P)H-binding protein [Jatrophihabitans sp.]|nr:NAD(P)H-binding protein [Jatrophihabitans sp.]
MRIVIAGGTGTAGRVVVEQAVARGHQAVALSRSAATPADLISGAGLAEALAGAEAVIDCSNLASQSRNKAERFFVTAAKNLVHAAADAGARHYVLLSIVGIDNVPMGYYHAKVAQEAALIATATEAQLGYTIARTTQFHDFAGQLLSRLRKGPLAPIPHLRIQPVELAEVARRLLDCAEGEPAGRVPDLGGPREEDLLNLVRQWLAHTGERVRVITAPLPGRVGRAVQAGGLLVTDGEIRGRTFAEWLADQPGSTAR